MGTDGEGRGDRTPTSDAGATTPRRTSKTHIILGCLAGLLIIAGAIYYLADDRIGTESTTGSLSERPAERPAAASNPRAADSSEKSASSTPPPQVPRSTEPQSPQPNEPQQSANATLPPTSSADRPAAPLASTAPMNPQPSEKVQPPDSTKAAQSTEPRANSTAQPSMRDQSAALPDQPAAAPKRDSILVVMRGPANIRSAPGKTGRVIGTAPKDATVKELDRSGNWVQVETEAGTGWISASLLGRRPTESR